jgi:hypothetical protein
MDAVALACDWIWAPLRALLSHPLLLAEVLFVAGLLLFPLLRALGAPLLVWHERPGAQRAVGAVATFAVAHAFFVVYLLEGEARVRAEPMSAAFLALWLGVVIVAVARRVARSGRLAPTLRAMRGTGEQAQLGALVSPEQPSTWPLVSGVAIALAALSVIAWAVYALDGWLDARLEPTVGALLRTLSLNELAARTERAPTLHVLAFLSLLGVLIAFRRARRRATPMTGLLMLLVIITALTGASEHWIGIPGIALGVVVFLLWRAGKQLFAIQIPELENLYDDPTSHYPPKEVSEGTTLLVDRLLGDDLVTRGWPSPNGDRDEKRPLILVCTSGGGIRAASWTAGILGQLTEQMPRFRELTLLVTGASGGMVGASAWLASLRRPGTPTPVPPGFADELSGAVGQDSLTDLARAWFFIDAVRSFSSAPNRGDRGRTMQARWQSDLQAIGADLGVRLEQLRDEEAQGRLPTAVYSPMIIEDGRRLLLSNASLARVVRAELPWVAVQPGQAAGRGASSTSAYHLRDISPAAFERITLATAARLSASFPYVSPAALLPTTPRTRLVDAGYYDNYGVNLVAGWLREALEHQRSWLERHVSRILVIQIRDEPFATDEPPRTESTPGGASTPPAAPRAPAQASSPVPADGTSFGARVQRALEGLTTPIEGMFQARGAAMRFRNDAELDAVSQSYEATFGDDFVLTQVFELKGEVSLSWYLTSAELRLIGEQLASPAIRRKLQDVETWASSGPARARSER